MEKVKQYFAGWTKVQKMIAITSAVIVVLGIVAAVICVGRMNGEQEIAPVASETKEEPDSELPVTEEVQEVRKLSFSISSIEKDLKIKIVDETESLVSGIEFTVTVTPKKEDAKGVDYTDEDKDGVIYITPIDAGEYIVQLHEEEGFEITENSVVAIVKAKIEYKAVNVKDEIKSEKDINASSEDTQKHTSTSQTPTETLPEVTTIAVDKNEVDTAIFPKATASTEKRESALMDNLSVALPQSVSLYESGPSVSNTCQLEAIITGDTSSVQEIAWSVTDGAIVSVTKTGNFTVTLVGKKAGTTTLTATITYTDTMTAETLTAGIQSEVCVESFDKNTTQLKDVSGNALYLDADADTPATIKDYETAQKFYKVVKKTEEYGIDVSKWQGTIDWEKVADSGVDFAIIRVGYRGSDTGALVEDPCFKQNIAGATKAGIKVGVYFFSQAITEAEAIEEASSAISLVDGYKLDYPIFIDTEYGKRANDLSKAKRTAIVKAFCETVKNAGYKPGVYAGKSWYESNLYASQLEKYMIWIARYNTQLGYTGKYDIWQHSDKGSIAGIKGSVDLNIRYF